MNSALIPQVIHVAVCVRCSTPCSVGRKPTGHALYCEECPPGSGHVKVETYRHAAKKERSGRKPRRNRRP
jgi:hypothetical protein